MIEIVSPPRPLTLQRVVNKKACHWLHSTTRCTLITTRCRLHGTSTTALSKYRRLVPGRWAGRVEGSRTQRYCRRSWQEQVSFVGRTELWSSRDGSEGKAASREIGLFRCQTVEALVSQQAQFVVENNVAHFWDMYMLLNWVAASDEDLVLRSKRQNKVLKLWLW